MDNAADRALTKLTKWLEARNVKAAYAANYAAYLPQWQAWRGAVTKYEAEQAAYKAWRAKFREAWEAYRQQGLEAAQRFETIYKNVVKRGRVELELSDPEHIYVLLREAFKESQALHPELGILRLISAHSSLRPPPSPSRSWEPLTPEELKALDDVVVPRGTPDVKAWLAANTHRQVNPVVAYNLPELSHLFDDFRLEATRDLLPPIPPLDVAGGDNRKRPLQPAKPTPPEGIIFFRDGGDLASPVPPDKVKWS